MQAFIRNHRGILAILLAMFLFVSNDAAMKQAGHAMPLTQTLFLRGVFAALLTFGVIAARSEIGDIPKMFHSLVAIRSLLEVCGSFMFQGALLLMPIGDATAIVQTVPLLLLGFAAVFLREKIRTGRIIAVVIGFAGALLVAAPSGAISFAAWLAFGTALVVVCRDMLAKHIGFSISPLVVTLAANIVVALTALASMPFGPHWTVPDAGGFALMLTAGICIAAAYVTMTLGLIWAQVQKLAPFYYSQTLYAVFYSLFLFGDVPGLQVLIGTTLILIAGLYTALPARGEKVDVANPVAP